MLFSLPVSKCGSFRVVSTPGVKGPEISEPWRVIFPPRLYVDVLLVLSSQVSEVLSEEKSRLSISGWFHGPSLTRPPTYFEPLIARSPHIPQDVRINSCCWDSHLRSCGVSFAVLFFIYLAALGLHCSGT